MRPLLVLLLTTLPSIARIATDPPPGVTIVDWAQIRAEYDRHRHTAFPDGEGFRARTRELGWNTRFDGRGFEIKPDEGGWRFGLELIGHDKALTTVNENRVTYSRSQILKEWFVNEGRGLEHGFTIQERSGPLELRLAVKGDLHGEDIDGAIRFCDRSGATILTYSEPKAWDAFGRDLPIHMSAQDGIIVLSVADSDAQYPVTIDPLVQQAYMKPAEVGTTQEGDFFGASVSLSGDTLVVGAPFEDSSSLGVNGVPNDSFSSFRTGPGAVYVFVRTAGSWSQQAYLKPAAVGTSQVTDNFGRSVAISGNTLVVGAPGENSSSLGINSTPNENVLAAGAAYVFVRSGGVWTQQAYLKPTAVGATQERDQFGYSVAISNDTIVVGAPGENSAGLGVNSTPDENGGVTVSTGGAGFRAGAAYIFVRAATAWSQQTYLKPAQIGATQSGDAFGFSVAISGDTAVVGAPNEDSSSLGINSTPNEGASATGAAYIFVRSTSGWSQQSYLKPPTAGGVWFGWSVTASGDTVAVGASSGAYVFFRTAQTWTQQGNLVSTEVQQLGPAVALSGDTLVVQSLSRQTDAASIYVFARGGGAWRQDSFFRPGNFGSIDWDGTSVAISGDTVVVGVPREDSSSLGVNSTPNMSATDAGAAYAWISGGPKITEVIDGGSLAPEITASAWVTIKGGALAPTTRIWLDSDFVQGRLPTSLNGVSVTIDGKPAYVYYISPTQINVLSGSIRAGSVPVIVTTSEGSTAFTATSKDRTPSWFMLDPENRKYVAAVNADGSIMGRVGLYPSAPNFTKPLPARGRGLIYGTSWGATNPAVPDGVILTSFYNIAGATIKIGGVNAVVEFAGVVTPGLFQFNIVAPDLPPGDYLIEGTINGASTQPGAYITLGPAQ